MKRNASSWTRAGARRLHMPFGPKLRTASKSSDERYVVQLSEALHLDLPSLQTRLTPLLPLNE